jgi:hypothetical protein
MPHTHHYLSDHNYSGEDFRINQTMLCFNEIFMDALQLSVKWDLNDLSDDDFHIIKDLELNAGIFIVKIWV